LNTSSICDVTVFIFILSGPTSIKKMLIESMAELVFRTLCEGIETTLKF
jgi:hypothetical protein